MIIDFNHFKNCLSSKSSLFKSSKNGIDQNAVSNSANKDERMDPSEDESKKCILIQEKNKHKSEQKEKQKKDDDQNGQKIIKKTDQSPEKIKKILNIL